MMAPAGWTRTGQGGTRHRQKCRQTFYNLARRFHFLGLSTSKFENKLGTHYLHGQKRKECATKRVVMHYGSRSTMSLSHPAFNSQGRYNLDASETFLPNLLHYCYNTHINDLRPRRLALLLMVLSIGSLVDLHRPLGSLHGEAYHHLARAAVCEIPLMEEPDFDVLHALVRSMA